jgi:hypothetical protein
MSQIWRDSFWGSDADDVSVYWSRLCPELNNAQAEAAVQALVFNDIDLATCKCTVRFALADAPDTERAVADLRELRDRGLRNTPLGQRVIELYYRHTDEVTAMLLEDGELRQLATALFTRAVEGYRSLKKGAEPGDVLLDGKHARLAQEFLTRVQRQGSPELQRDFDEVHRLVEQLEGRSYEEVRRKFEQRGDAK